MATSPTLCSSAAALPTPRAAVGLVLMLGALMAATAPANAARVDFATTTVALAHDATPRSVAVADVNGDGHRDLLSANMSPSTVSVLLGDGTGDFTVTTVALAEGIAPVSVATADLDGDGHLDLATANLFTSDVSVLLGDGTGDFTPAATGLAGGSGPFSVTAADVDADGHTDLVTANANSHDVSVLLGDGAGGFTATTAGLAGGASPRAVATGDVDGDGQVDLVTANATSDDVSVLLGDGAGGFAAATAELAGGTEPVAVAAGDVDGDGLVDVVAANDSSHDVSVLWGDGAGGFTATTVDHASADGPVAVATGDLDGDGRLDLATANDSADSLSLLLRNPTNQPPAVEAGNEVTGPEGAAIALDGTVTDLDAGDTVTTTWTFAAGADVDAGASCAFADASAVDTTVTCTDDGAYTLTLTADDGVNPPQSATATVAVTNAAPAIGAVAGPPRPLPVDTMAGVSASFTDPGTNDTVTCVVEWGDGSVATVRNPAASPCDAEHEYPTPGTYPITVTATDDDGAAERTTIEVVVYDPDGAVAGGGRLDSPAGAYPAKPDVAGTATFTWTAAYRQPASTPHGQAQFRLRAADLRFRATAFDWLVVADGRAQTRGSGTLNGHGGYGVLLTAVDEPRRRGHDRLRVRIWDEATGETVYDNGAAVASDAPAGDRASVGEAVTGGQVVIHRRG